MVNSGSYQQAWTGNLAYPVHMWADVSTYFLSFVVVIILSSKQHEDPLHIALTAVHFHY